MSFQDWSSSTITRGVLFLSLASLASLASLGLVVGSCTGPTTRQYDVIIVSIDTLRLDSLGFLGGGVADGVQALTPNIDAIAESGTSFSQAIAPMPRTTPALASMLTGLYPHRHGSREVGDPVTNGRLLSERLRDAGYSTLAVSANQSAGPKQNLDQGFDEFVDGLRLKELYAERLDRYDEDGSGTGVGWAEATTNEALRLIEAVPADQPLLLWTLYFDPHFVYRPPSAWRDDVDAGTCWQMTERLLGGEVTCGELVDDMFGEASAALDGCKRLYQAEVNYTDSEIGRLLDGLREAGRLDNTVIVFTADHGENLGEDGLYYEHGENVHDVAIRVPLVIAGAGALAGKVDAGSAGLIDVLPTLLDLLGLQQEQALDGISLKQRLLRPPSSTDNSHRRPMFAESGTGFCRNSTRLFRSGRMEGRSCVHEEPYSYCRGPSGSAELFDHIEDLAMKKNVLGTMPKVEEHLATAFDRWPAETARQRTVRLPGLKLVQTPLFEGGYDSTLWDLQADDAPRDVTIERASLAARLNAVLEDFFGVAGTIEARALDEDLVKSLRALGYIR